MEQDSDHVHEADHSYKFSHKTTGGIFTLTFCRHCSMVTFDEKTWHENAKEFERSLNRGVEKYRRNINK